MVLVIPVLNTDRNIMMTYNDQIANVIVIELVVFAKPFPHSLQKCGTNKNYKDLFYIKRNLVSFVV